MEQSVSVVYRLPSDWKPKEFLLEPQAEWEVADPRNVSRLFASDPVRRKLFLDFLRRGYFGIIVHIGDTWTSHLWMSVPETKGPPHLPRPIQRLPVYWLCSAHTAKFHRGRGQILAATQLMIQYARKQDASAEVYAETHVRNISARKGLVALGFVPEGVLRHSMQRLPFGKRLVWGHWNKGLPHPHWSHPSVEPTRNPARQTTEHRVGQ